MVKAKAGTTVAPAASRGLPAVSADGQFLAQAGRYARGVTLAAFQGIGGLKRLTEVADEDPKWFYEKLFSKLVQPERQVVAESEDDVEDLLKKLDRRVIDVDVVPVAAPAGAGGGDDGEDDDD